MTEWRLMIEGARDGAANMGWDQAIAEAVASGDSPPTLRLYRWEPPAVSIGWGQALERGCDVSACQAEGWTVVRRPTGGRAVLHDRTEVTYAVMLPLREAPDGVLAAYRWLAQGLMAGLEILGLGAELARADRAEGSSPACFDAPATSELTVGGRKVIGSAQVRRSGYLLQHGSVPLRFDAALHVRLLGLHGGQAAERWLQRRAAGLSDAAGRDLTWDEVAEALVEGWRRVLGVQMVPGPASTGEAERAEVLRQWYGDAGTLTAARPRPAGRFSEVGPE